MLITETYAPEMNGVAMTLSKLSDGLLSRGHHVHIVRPKQNRHDKRAKYPANPSSTLVWDISFPWYKGLKLGLPYFGQLRHNIKRFKPDFIHIATEGPLGIAGILAAHAYGVPAVSSYHTNFFTYARYYKLGFLRIPGFLWFRALHNATLRTFVPSQTVKHQLEVYKYKNIEIMSRGVDTATFSPAQRSTQLRNAWGAAADDIVMLYVGRVAKEKNVPLMIACYEKLRQTHPTAKMVIVGDGPEYARLEREYPHFIFAGKRSGTSLAQHYASADLFVFPSFTETYGNVIMEAMASGLVVLAYDYAAAREHIVDGENGYTAAFKKEDLFMARFDQMLKEQAHWWKVTKAGRETTERLSWENVVANYEKTLLELMSGKTSQTPPTPTKTTATTF